METMTLSIKNDELTSIKNFVGIMPVIKAFLSAGDGLVNLDANDILDFIKNAKEIRMQQFYINNITEKYKYDYAKDIPEETKIGIRKDLKQMLADANVKINTGANKRLILTEGNISLAVSDGICEILGKDIEFQWAIGCASWPAVMRMAIIDIYE